jgi:hypothetical protein
VYGGSTVPTEEITSKINAMAAQLFDAYQSVPPPG